MRAFFQNQTGIYASLSFLPADGDITNACAVTSYEPPSTDSVKVPLTLLDATGRQTFLERLCDPTVTPLASTCVVPGGGRPTRPALQGTIAYAATVQQMNFGSKTVVIFLAAGDPGVVYVPSGSSTASVLNSCDDLTNGCPLGPVGPTGTGICTSAAAEVAKVTGVIRSAPAKSINLFALDGLSSITATVWANGSGNAAVAMQGMSSSQMESTLSTALDSLVATLMQ